MMVIATDGIEVDSGCGIEFIAILSCFLYA